MFQRLTLHIDCRVEFRAYDGTGVIVNAPDQIAKVMPVECGGVRQGGDVLPRGFGSNQLALNSNHSCSLGYSKRLWMVFMCLGVIFMVMFSIWQDEERERQSAPWVRRFRKAVLHKDTVRGFAFNYAHIAEGGIHFSICIVNILYSISIGKMPCLAFR